MPSKEVWQDIPGWEGWYQASKRGQIQSLDRFVECPMGSSGKKKCIKFLCGRVLKQHVDDLGYCHLELRCKGDRYSYLVHRLVAMVFLPNPKGLPEVNHKDFNPRNNAVSNLQWVSPLGNVGHSKSAGRIPRGKPNGMPSLRSQTSGRSDIFAIFMA